MGVLLQLIGIPVAAGVLYPALHLTLNPMLAAAAMSLSSVLRGVQCPALFQSQGKEENTVNKTIHIDGMMCTHCTGRVERPSMTCPA